MSGALTAETARLTGQMQAFLNFCRLEKGLSANSLDAYTLDLAKWREFMGQSSELPGPEGLRHYLDHLYQSGLSQRSIARHLTTLRGLYAFLLREGQIAIDPTEHLGAPKQWHTIPKFLNLQDIEKIIQAIDTTRPTGLRDRAMLELLYATGLRVSELCHLGLSDWCRWGKLRSRRSQST
jgi:integrase/recombinase XerD